jgi:ribosomal protein S18 acetylase RimI-like enzyme
MSSEGLDGLEIRSLSKDEEVAACARMMCNSEPWITLRRDYEASVATLTAPGKEVHLATMGEEVVGFTILNMQGAFVGYIQTVCIAPQWRNRGIGSRLLDFAEDRILSQVPNVFMCVSSFNADARRLYLRRGYEVVGELKDYIVAGHSEILMRKTIAPLTGFVAKAGQRH